MAKFVPIAQLVAVKKRLGQIVFLDYRTLDLITAHQKLGEEVKWQVQKILTRKLDKLNDEQLVEQIRFIRQCRSAIKEKLLSSRIEAKMRSVVREYLACLSAWGHGAWLDRFQYPRFHNLIVDNKPVSSDDLALLLQNDNSGCQTGVYREGDGSVILWHTEEEETSSRFDKLRIVSFQVRNSDRIEEINVFVYPDLLPGPAYCWRNDNFVQAVDALYLKPNPHYGSMLANVATWITLRLGKEVEPKEVIEALGPFVDGYVLTIVQEKDEQVFADKIEFAGDQMLVSSLDNNIGSFLFQVNVFSRKDELIAIMYEDIDLNTRNLFEERIVRTKRALRRVRGSNNALHCLFKLLSSRLGGDYAYANDSVKSYFINRVDSRGMEIWIGEGPVVGDSKPRIITLKN